VSSWKSEAACRGHTALMFSTDPVDVAIAVALCRGCPVREPCLDEALATGAEGVWGATTEPERVALRVGAA
jgi:WhiB family redox-sensing transcriptional regulator